MFPGVINENDGAFLPINEFELINWDNVFEDNPCPNRNRKSIIEANTINVNTIFFLAVIFLNYYSEMPINLADTTNRWSYIRGGTQVTNTISL